MSAPANWPEVIPWDGSVDPFPTEALLGTPTSVGMSILRTDLVPARHYILTSTGPDTWSVMLLLDSINPPQFGIGSLNNTALDVMNVPGGSTVPIDIWAAAGPATDLNVISSPTGIDVVVPGTWRASVDLQIDYETPGGALDFEFGISGAALSPAVRRNGFTPGIFHDISLSAVVDLPGGDELQVIVTNNDAVNDVSLRIHRANFSVNLEVPF